METIFWVMLGVSFFMSALIIYVLYDAQKERVRLINHLMARDLSDLSNYETEAKKVNIYSELRKKLHSDGVEL